MARLTKKQLAEQRDREREARIQAALHWTPAPDGPDVPIPTDWQGLSTGWLVGYDGVAPGCSSTVHHSYGRTDRTDSQNPRPLYSTKLRALRALRSQVERRCAEQLATVDAQIALAEMEA